MELKPIWFGSGSQRKKEPQTFFAMRILLLLTLLIHLAANGQPSAAKITLSLQNSTLETAFAEIKKQTGYVFIYTREQLGKAAPVSLSLREASLQTALRTLFENQPFSFIIDGNHIALRERNAAPAPPLAKEITGLVHDEKGQPLSNISVTVKPGGRTAATNEKGVFVFDKVGPRDVLEVTAVGYRGRSIPVGEKTYFDIELAVAVSEMDETVIIAYGTTTRRLATGNVTRITAREIEKQPVSNPLAALVGRVPGAIITQSSGVPGSAFKVEIRGRSALDLALSRNDPLIIIDGLPFEPGNGATNQLLSAANNPTSASEGGLSPLNSIPPSDIESIEILKDADATAIYGSRGANGVILITTKKGKSGKVTVTTGLYTGISKATRTMRMMNTQEYVAMRRGAFANDGITPTIANAPDILLWDTTRYTDFQRLLIGNTANTTDVTTRIAGGSGGTSFSIGGSYHRETTVFPGDFADRRASLNFNVAHSTANKKLSLSLTGLYSNDNNRLITLDITQYLRLPPNLLLYDSSGALAWQEKGVPFSSLNSFVNPLSQLHQQYESINNNLSSIFNLRYEPAKGLAVKINLGYNLFTSEETSIRPKISIAPTSSTLASSSFANGKIQNWIAEPQVEYSGKFKAGTLTVLMGTSFQEKKANGSTIAATNYTSDLLLYSVAAAGDVTGTNYSSQYRYSALFGRVGFNHGNKYLVNLSGRRDGSSRFGPGRQFANFGALGLGWVFSSEAGFAKKFSFISFGKLRGSIGVTGNDQIGDYKFYDLWNNTVTNYQGSSGLIPTGLFNPVYHWEKSKKAEIALDLGIVKDRILFSLSYYRHRSSNQLVNYNLPVQAGFTTVVRNLPALVQNTGLEIMLSSSLLKSKDFSWNTSLTMTIPRNKLISFPGLAQSPYFNTYTEGASLTTIKRYRFLGVDPSTGIYAYEDVNKDGALNSADFQVLGNRDANYFGGLQNSFRYKDLSFDFFVQFVKQRGNNYLSNFYSTVPGTAFNQPTYALSRWQNPGEMTHVQKYTTLSSSPASLASNRLNSSDGIYSDASFVRLKTVSITYNFAQEWTRKIGLEGGRVYVNAQNLLTLTNFIGADPENQRFFQVPPLKTIVLGIQFNF